MCTIELLVCLLCTLIIVIPKHIKNLWFFNLVYQLEARLHNLNFEYTRFMLMNIFHGWGGGLFVGIIVFWSHTKKHRSSMYNRCWPLLVHSLPTSNVFILSVQSQYSYPKRLLWNTILQNMGPTQ